MKLGSLFDGSGGFPLAGSLCGIEPVWAAEVEPYPIAVTRSRFPNMKHLGDISKVNGAEIEPVDIITFGSPCQDLSTAGLRKGLKHEANGDDETTRSGLFMEAVRIIKEMRKATGGRYPRWALWENVPGAFSSSKGEDFRVVLEELIGVVEPRAVMPPVPKAGWAYADSYTGDGWSLAYRVFDAQYWGVPPRRRRIHLVVDFRGTSAQGVLFEREGLHRYPAEGQAPRQGAAGDFTDGPGADDFRGEGAGAGGRRQLAAVGADIYNLAITGDKVGSLTAGGYNSTGSSPKILQPGIAVKDAASFIPETGGGDPRRSISYAEELAPCLRAGFTPAVSFHLTQDPITSDEKTPCISSGSSTHGQATVGVALVLDDQGGQQISVRTDGKSPTLRAETHGNLPCVLGQGSEPHYIVRRLTPTECARLQGFPDDWGRIDKKDSFTDEECSFWLEVRNTHAAINGKPVKEYTKPQMQTWYNKLQTNSAEYKMWGNGIALPPALYCMQGIAEAMDREDEDSWMF
jgi:DNA (cytosine-5)-methyltransferase 1